MNIHTPLNDFIDIANKAKPSADSSNQYSNNMLSAKKEEIELSGSLRFIN